MPDKRMDLINSGGWGKRAFDLVGSVSSLTLNYNTKSSKGRLAQAQRRVVVSGVLCVAHRLTSLLTSKHQDLLKSVICIR